MRVYWKVDDGFVGNGEHFTDIDVEDLEGLNPQQREMEIEEWISEDFSRLVSFEVIIEESDKS